MSELLLNLTSHRMIREWIEEIYFEGSNSKTIKLRYGTLKQIKKGRWKYFIFKLFGKNKMFEERITELENQVAQLQCANKIRLGMFAKPIGVKDVVTQLLKILNLRIEHIHVQEGIELVPIKLEKKTKSKRRKK